MNLTTALERLRRWVREHRDDRAELRLPRPQVKALLDELGRLQQSQARLRQQNKKLRVRAADDAIVGEVGDGERERALGTDGDDAAEAP